MLANYEEHGFEVTAEILPEACTACPFWGYERESAEMGCCMITGTEIKADGPQDIKRMDDCPIIERKAGRGA